MRSRPVALLLTATALGTGAARADAAEIRVDRPCFADPADRADVVRLRGTGFTPNSSYAVLLDGEPLRGATGRTSAAGTVSGRFAAPSIRTVSSIAQQHVFRLSVRTPGRRAARTTFTVSRVFASFAPRKGDPARLRVRFKLYGFKLRGARRPSVFVHYVAPGGRLARTVRIGTATQDCGFLRTSRRRLFGFAPRRGAWRLQLDTRRRYTRGTSRSRFLYFSLGVLVR